MKAILEVQKASKQYGSGEGTVYALRGVSFSIEQGEFVGIMGASGCGKSTLLNLVSTIDSVTSGSILLGNREMTNLTESQLADFRKHDLGFVFQDYNLLDTLTLRENIALALTIQNKKKGEIDITIGRIAAKLGIEATLDKYPYQVSGGQRQRCACARAVACEPKLILADEPTGALDSTSAQNLMQTFSQLNEDLGVTILMVTHDAFSACYCERVLFMKDGQVVSELRRDCAEHSTFIRRILSEMAGINGGDGNVY